MRELWIWHHMGMGDVYTCNGMVRHFAEQYDKIHLFYKDPNKENVKYLYRDLKNIDFIDGGVHEDNLAKLWQMTHPGYPLMKIGFDYLNRSKLLFDQAFYEQAMIPISYKWDKFYLERDEKREKEVYYDILGLKDNEEFIFLHNHPDYETRGIPSDIKIIRPTNKEVKLPGFLYTIEKAKEVHLMNSAFLCLVDAMRLIDHDNMFYHAYIRNIEMQLTPNWKILT